MRGYLEKCTASILLRCLWDLMSVEGACFPFEVHLFISFKIIEGSLVLGHVTQEKGAGVVSNLLGLGILCGFIIRRH